VWRRDPGGMTKWIIALDLMDAGDAKAGERIVRRLCECANKPRC